MVNRVNRVNKKLPFIIGICILSVGIMGLAAMKAGRPAEEKAERNAATEAERETVYYDFLTANTVSMLERSNLISDCELNVDFTDGEISGITLKLGISSEDTGNGSLTAEGKNDILKYVSTVFDFPAESIVLSIM